MLYKLILCFMYVLLDHLVPSNSPRNVTALSVNPSSLFISWLPPLLIDHNGHLTAFTILYKQVNSDNVLTVHLSANVTMYKITQLVPSTKYKVQVACTNVNGTGPFSAPVRTLSGDNSKFVYICFNS